MRHSHLVVKHQSIRRIARNKHLNLFKPSVALTIWALTLSNLTPRCFAEEKEIPEDLLDDEHVREEAGVNSFTSPSIDKIFKDLAALAPFPPEALQRAEPENPPIQQSNLALELGRLIADGFLMVQSGQTDQVETLARQLNRYARALGIGDRVNRHAASLLDHAKNKRLEELREELKKTQQDVERELVLLRDPGLASLIGLGGWLRAFDAASLSLEARFSPERAQLLIRPDIPDYFLAMMETLPPPDRKHRTIQHLTKELEKLQQTLQAAAKKTPEPSIAKILRKHAQSLASQL